MVKDSVVELQRIIPDELVNTVMKYIHYDVFWCIKKAVDRQLNRPMRGAVLDKLKKDS